MREGVRGVVGVAGIAAVDFFELFGVVGTAFFFVLRTGEPGGLTVGEAKDATAGMLGFDEPRTE